MEIQQIWPASCGGLLKSTKPGRVIAEEKIDGHRGLMHVGRDLDRMYLTGRRLSAKTGIITEKGQNIPHLAAHVHAYFKEKALGYTVLDGEVVLPGRPFEDVQSVMGAHPDTAIGTQRNTGAWMHYRVFDILILYGCDVRDRSLEERRQLLNLLVQEIGHEYMSPVVQAADRAEFFKRIVEAGGEGTVEKDLDAPYGCGWQKNKKAMTYDVVVTGFAQGQGKYREMVGAVQFGAFRDGKLVNVGQCSGMSDGNVWWSDAVGNTVRPNSEGSRIRASKVVPQPEGTRAWFSQHREGLLGKVIEVKCNGVTKHGALRHPQFYRLRPDKAAEQCSMPK